MLRNAQCDHHGNILTDTIQFSFKYMHVEDITNAEIVLKILIIGILTILLSK